MTAAAPQPKPQDAQALDYASPETQAAVAKRLGFKGDAVQGCLARGAKYGAQAGLLAAGAGGVDPVTQGAAWLVGGLYGCSRGNGFGQVWRETKGNLRQAAKGVKAAGSWMRRLVTGELFESGGKKSKGRRTPPSLHEALYITRRYFEEGHEGQVFLSGKRWLTPSVLSALYGPAAAAWEPGKLARMWWSQWERSKAQEPGWDADFRLFHALSRVGHFLELAPEGARIEDWPVKVPREALVPEAQHVVDANNRLQGVESVETSQPVLMNEPSPAGWLWGLVGLLGGAA